MYVNGGELLTKASANGYAVGAFNAENAEMVWAIIAAAEELEAPAIIQTTSGTLRYLGPDYFAGMVIRAAQKAKVPVALHLDHGPSFNLARECIDEGYSSVMIDGSALPYEENVELTRQVCLFAAGKDISVEGELGVIGGKEDDTVADDARYTDPAQSADFARRTGVSSLAISIGTAHGFYATEPVLNLDLIAMTRKLVSVPLVLHGASGLSDVTVNQAVKLGMAKVNFATELRAAYTKAIQAYIAENPQTYDPKNFGQAAREAVKQLVMHKIEMCGSQGRG